MKKLLNEKYRIAVVDMPGAENNIQIRYNSSADIIILNSTAPYLKELVELMVTYLEQEDQSRKEILAVSSNDILNGVLHTVARIVRIRRKMKRFKCA